MKGNEMEITAEIAKNINDRDLRIVELENKIKDLNAGIEGGNQTINKLASRLEEYEEINWTEILGFERK
jgi:archaellum component FlaC